MGKKENLLAKLQSMPKDFTFEEAQTLLELLGFELSNKGRTSGSRVKFTKGNVPIYLHKPHPRKELLEYQLKDIIKTLKQEGLL